MVKKLISKLRKGMYQLYYRVTLQRTGINLVGYFSNVIGVAEVGRFFAIKLKESRIPFKIYNIESGSHAKLDIAELKKYSPFFVDKLPYHASIVFVNADAVPVMAKLHPHVFRHHYNVGVFWWEFNDYFYSPNAFEHIHEVIVFSEFIATAVRKTAPLHVNVTKLPFPFVINWQITIDPFRVRSRFGIGDSDFVYVFNFDFLSILERKNPKSILKAFSQAFSTQTDVKLVLKTIHAEAVPEKFQEFISMIESLNLMSKVLIVNDNLTRDEMICLINACDVYVSLHRSEGLGIGMLEAMSLGKPVIGTGFGGNMDFMRADVALIVDYQLVQLEEDALPYRKGWLWADPNIDQAAEYMEMLYHDRSLAKLIGEKGKKFIEAHYSLANFTKAVDEWINNRFRKIIKR